MPPDIKAGNLLVNEPEKKNIDNNHFVFSISGGDLERRVAWLVDKPADVKHEGGDVLAQALSDAAKERGIEVLLETPAKQLVANAEGRVLGVVADQGGVKIHIKARKDPRTSFKLRRTR